MQTRISVEWETGYLCCESRGCIHRIYCETLIYSRGGKGPAVVKAEVTTSEICILVSLSCLNIGTERLDIQFFFS